MNIHPENSQDLSYFSFDISKIKLNDEVLKSQIFDESQKLKLLDYFAEVIKNIRRAGYHNLVRQNSDKALREEDVAHLIAPREEFYGSSILNFHFGDSVLLDRVLNGLREETEDEILLFRKLFSGERRIMELDMNMMSPIAWSLQNKQFVTA